MSVDPAAVDAAAAVAATDDDDDDDDGDDDAVNVGQVRRRTFALVSR